ncbi:MAG: homocysteine S-methyltransferase family protein [Planctomycetota bacterium]|jgi:S-methylmethionine-dependent homocysteine/selenocysteine methylase
MTTDSLTLLDGAMGTQLRARGVPVRDYKTSLWSALACADHPDAVVGLHREYIEAGADIITANNYAITPRLLARECAESRLPELLALAGRCARLSLRGASRAAQIAASLPPLGTTYATQEVGPFDTNVEQYRRIIEHIDPFADLYIAETMSTANEARAAAHAASESNKPFMISWTLDPSGHNLRSSESLEHALRALDGYTPQALLVNCSCCNAASQAIRTLRDLTDVPIGAYANPVLHEPDTGEPQRVPTSPLGPDEFAAQARAWIDDGARLLGGCCDTNPAHIAALHSLRTPDHGSP